MDGSCYFWGVSEVLRQHVSLKIIKAQEVNLSGGQFAERGICNQVFCCWHGVY